MGCSNTKLHAQQIAYQRDFLGACWNSSLGEEESEEYLASRWMGVSKNVMALYTNNHCFTVRTLNKDEKARTDAAAAGKTSLKAADDPTGLAPGLGGDLGAGGGGAQSPSASVSLADSPALSAMTRATKTLSNTASSFMPFPETPDRRDPTQPTFRSATSSSPPPPPTAAPSKLPAPTTTTTTTTTTTQRTTVRQNTSHVHAITNTSVASAADDHTSAMNPSSFAGAARAAVAEKKKKGADPTALRNVMKDSLESERVLHADHPYLQRHGLSVYGGVVFRCAPAHRLYHRISLVPEASMKRLYDMQVTAMSRSLLGDPSASLRGLTGGWGGGENGHDATYHHFQPGASSSDNPRLLPSLNDGEEQRGVPPMTPPQRLSHAPSMVPSPMNRPINGPSTSAASAEMEKGGNASSTLHLSSSLPFASLPSMPLSAVAARHLRFASGPEMQQSAVIDTWAAQNPLSTFNNYPAEDRDVAGVTATRPPVIIGSVTAMELQALPPNAELCFGGWLCVSLQDEQERLRRSLKRYVARQRRRAAKAAAEDAMRFSSASSSSAYRSRSAPLKAKAGPNETSSRRATDAWKGLSDANEVEQRSDSFTMLPPPSMPAGNAAAAEGKDADGGEERVPADGLVGVSSQTMPFKGPAGSPVSQTVRKLGDGDGGERLHKSGAESTGSEGSDDALGHTTAFAGTSITDVALASTKPPATEAEKASARDGEAAPVQLKPPPPLRERMHVDPLDISLRLKDNLNATTTSPSSGPQHTPSRTPSRLRQRNASVPPSPATAAMRNPATTPLPLLHTGRYAREAMEADALTATWLPYAYIVVAVPMYECSLVPTTFHTAFTRHKAVSLNIGNAQSRQAYGVGCITGVRYGGVMIIEYRDKVDDEADAEWIAELIRVGRTTQRADGGAEKKQKKDGGDDDDDDNDLPMGANPDLSASAIFRHLHHSATHRARAEKLRRVKSRIWHKLRRQGLHVVLAATRMADRRHRQQRAAVASELNNLFSSNYADAAAATMGASQTPQHFAAGARRTPSTLNQNGASVSSGAAGAVPRGNPSVSRNANVEAARGDNAGEDEGGVGADYAGGGAEELNEAMADAVDDFDSTASSRSGSTSSSSSSSSSESGGGGGGSLGRGSRSSAVRRDGGSVAGPHGDRTGKKKKDQWWRSSSSRRRHRGHRDSVHGDVEMGPVGPDGRGSRGRHHHHHHHHHGATARDDRLSWADPQMADDFYLRGTFRQIGGMKYLDVVSLMDGCPVSELVQGIKRWVVNLLSMPIKARPVCLFLQRYEGIAASLRVMQSQLIATALAANVASGKQLAQANLSFNMPSGGPTGVETNIGMDEIVASFAAQHTLDPAADAASPSALVNASFAALQAPALPMTRTLVYHSYYCGPLEPEVRAVLSPEIEAMIASCQTRLLPAVLQSPASHADEDNSDASTAHPLSPSLRAAASVAHSGHTNDATPTPSTKLSSASPSAAAAAARRTSAHASSEAHSSKAGASQSIDVNPQASPKQHLSPTHAHQAHQTHSNASVQSSSPQGSFAAKGAGGAPEADTTAAAAAAHAKPPANTVPKTITECLFYDDPTMPDKSTKNSFTASNGQALAAAAAALMLAENAKGPAVVANASLGTAPSVNTGSFPAAHGPTDEMGPMMLPSASGGSRDHVKGLKEAAAPTNLDPNNNSASLISLGDLVLHPDRQTHDVANGSLSKTKQANSTPTTKADPRDLGGDSLTGSFSRREGQAGGTRASSANPLLLLPAAHACNHSHSAHDHQGDDDHDDDDDSDSSFHDDAAEERELEWQLADRELRALRSELDEMTYHTTTARGELLERLEELIQLGALFLPHTRPDQVGLCLITMKMLRQYPEEVPVKEINTDWVPLLMTLLTSSRENLFCASGYDGGDLARMVSSAQGFLTTYNNIVDASDMCDANKRRQACDAGVTKYMIDPLPPMPAPRRLHDVVIAPQPVRFTKTLLHDMQRIGMDSEGLSFSFSGGSVGVLAGVLYYYSDFLRAKYRSEVAAVGGRAKDAGATVLDVLSRGGYNVLLRRIWIWGVTPESKSAASYNPAAATMKLLQKTRSRGDDANSDGSSPSTPLPIDERDYVTTNTAGVGNGYVRVVGKPFRGTEAYALYDAIVHYLRTLEELYLEHNGNNSMAPQAPVKRRSVLMAWRRTKDGDPSSGGGGNGGGGSKGKGNGAEVPSSGADGAADEASGARDLVPTFEVCVASNYYYKRMLDEAHWPARRRTTESTLPHRTGPDGTRLPQSHQSSMADVRARLPVREGGEAVAAAGPRRLSNALSSVKTSGSPTVARPPTASHKHKRGGGGSSTRDESSVFEQPYCGGEETVKKDALQRKATKKFYSFLSDHYEQWRAKHGEDRTTSSYGKRISVSMS